MPTDQEIIGKLPHEKPRLWQLEAIKFALDSFNSGKRFVILEAPTGSGKSAIGVTVSSFFNTSYYLTIQKHLQSQIINDYSPAGMVELKGRNAYECTVYKHHGDKLVNGKVLTQESLRKVQAKTIYCDRGYCKTAEGKNQCKLCCPDDLSTTCPYYQQIDKAVRAQQVLMNFSSFLFQIHYTGRFGQRDLMVIDEAHQCESQLMDFISLTLSDISFIDHGIELPKTDNPCEYAVWIHDNGILALVGSMVADARSMRDLDREEELNRLYRKLVYFMKCIAEETNEWVCEHQEVKLAGRRVRTVTMKPVFVSFFAPQLLFNYSNKVLLMSATILDQKVVCKSLGIKADQVAFYQVPSTFPKENRPIYIVPAGKFTGGVKKMHEWGPKLIKAVDNIVSNYPDDRGIIHTHNFAIAELLMNNGHERGRFLYQKNFGSKELMLAAHAKSKNSIIVAPAMHEGLDLRDALSRFQLICKVPWPNFFEDKQLARRMEVDRSFILWLVAQKLVQSYGRSIRSDTDWAHTYIIDGTITKFLQEAKRMIPSWFREAIIEDD